VLHLLPRNDFPQCRRVPREGDAARRIYGAARMGAVCKSVLPSPGGGGSARDRAKRDRM